MKLIARTALAALIICAINCICIYVYAAGDSSKWGHDPDTSNWFKSLKNGNGTPCCDYADGTRLEDPGDYKRNDDGSYEVNVDGQWLHVEKERVLQGSNRVGYAILWRMVGPPHTVWCFLPGVEL